MRTNLTGFALTVGMGLIVILMVFGLLSAAGLVGFGASDAIAEQQAPEAFGCGTISELRTDSITLASFVASPEEKAGDALFRANCAQCHAVNNQVVGPALANIKKRRRINWVVSWVHNSAKVVASGDEYAVKLFNDNGQQQMPSFPELSSKDIENIVAWINSPAGGRDRIESYTIQD
jgi:mono/diheme cytochrome c family protein